MQGGDKEVTSMNILEYRTASGQDILILYFRPPVGPLPGGPTTLSTIGFSMNDPKPECLEEISRLYLEAAAALRARTTECPDCGAIGFHDCEPLL